jgi:voltage-gated potassium channel
MGYTRKFLISLRRPVMIYMVTVSITAQLFFAAIFYWAEVDHNSKLVTFFDSLYFTVTLMTSVGLGDIVPVTTIGRALAIVMMLAGTAIYVCFTAVLAAMIMEADPEADTNAETDSDRKGTT